MFNTKFMSFISTTSCYDMKVCTNSLFCVVIIQVVDWQAATAPHIFSSPEQVSLLTYHVTWFIIIVSPSFITGVFSWYFSAWTNCEPNYSVFKIAVLPYYVQCSQYSYFFCKESTEYLPGIASKRLVLSLQLLWLRWLLAWQSIYYYYCDNLTYIDLHSVITLNTSVWFGNYSTRNAGLWTGHLASHFLGFLKFPWI